MRLIIPVFAALCCALLSADRSAAQAPAPLAGVSPDAARALQSANALADSARYPEAAAAYRLLIEQFPADRTALPARLGLAEALLEVGQLAESQRLFEELQARQPSAEMRGRALLGQSRIALAAGDPRRALSLADGALPLLDENSRHLLVIHYVRGAAYQHLEQWGAARRAYGRVIAAPGSRFAAEAEHGIALCLLGEGESLLAANSLLTFARARARAAEAPDALRTAARLFAAEKRWEDASACYSEFLSRHSRQPDAPAMHLALVEARLALNDIATATATLQGMIAVYPRTAEATRAHVWLGDLRLAQRDYLGAARHYGGASLDLLEAPARTQALLRQGEAEARAGLASLAVDTLTAAIAAAAGSEAAVARLQLVEALIDVGRLEDAGAALARLDPPRGAGVALVRARLLLARRDFAGARAALEPLAAGPSLEAWRARVLLARVALESGDPAAAIRQLRALLDDPELPPDQRPAALLALGAAQAASGDRQASDTLARVAAEFPGHAEAPAALAALAGFERAAGREAPAAAASRQLAAAYPEFSESAAALVRRADRERRAGNVEVARALYGEYLRSAAAAAQRRQALAGLALVAAVVGDVAEADRQQAALTAEAPPPDELAQFHAELGQAYQSAGRLERALVAWRAAAAEADLPTGAASLAAAGALLGRLGAYAEATSLLTAALAEDAPLTLEQRETAQTALARAHAALSNDELAARAYRLLLEAASPQVVAEAALFLGERAFRTGEHAQARPLFARIIAQGEAAPPAALATAEFRLACCAQLTGQYAEAATEFARIAAQEGNPWRWEARCREAQCYRAAGATPAAIAAFRRVMAELAPADGEEARLVVLAQLGAGELLFASGAAAAAVDALRPAALPRWGGQGLRAALLLAEAHLASEAPREAAAVLERIAAEFPATAEERAEALFRAGEAWRQAGDAESASRPWRRLLADFPETSWAETVRQRLTEAAGG